MTCGARCVQRLPESDGFWYLMLKVPAMKSCADKLIWMTQNVRRKVRYLKVIMKTNVGNTSHWHNNFIGLIIT